MQLQDPSCPAQLLEPTLVPGDAESVPARVTWLLLPSSLWCTVFNSTYTQDSPSAPAQSTGSHVLSSSWVGRDKRSQVQAHTRRLGCPSTCKYTQIPAQIPASLPASEVPISRLVQFDACCKHCTHTAHRHSTLMGSHGRQEGSLPVR